jgi:hypothetical protein
VSSSLATYLASSWKFHKYLSEIFKRDTSGHENITIIKKRKKIGKIKFKKVKGPLVS